MNKLRKEWRRLLEGIAIFGLIGLAFEGIKSLSGEGALAICGILALIAFVCYLIGWLVED